MLRHPPISPLFPYTPLFRSVGQMAAERLHISLSQVSVEVGDSLYPPAPVAGGSNQTASCCSVVMKACEDRKSTRLNSSHPSISYAVFCLKKKKKIKRSKYE